MFFHLTAPCLVLLALPAASADSLAAPSCHLGGCAAETEIGVHLLQAEGTKKARRKAASSKAAPPSKAAPLSAAAPWNSSSNTSSPSLRDFEGEPFTSLTQIHSEALGMVKHLLASRRVRGTFNLLIILPVLGFLATLLAICATAAVEERANHVRERVAQGGHTRPSVHGPATWTAENVMKGLRHIVLGDQHQPRMSGSGHSKTANPWGMPTTPLGSPGAASLLQGNVRPGDVAAGGQFSPSFADNMGFPAEGDTVVVHGVGEDGKLGLKLLDDSLEITGFWHEDARRYGFHIGDRITQVNSVPVQHQDDFMQQLQMALEENKTKGTPMFFTVIRAPKNSSPATMDLFGKPAESARPSSVMGTTPRSPLTPYGQFSTVDVGLPQESARSSAPVEQTSAPDPRIQNLSRSTTFVFGSDMLGSWEYSDENRTYVYHITKEKAHGILLNFSQRLPNGDEVTGTLSPIPDGWYHGPLSHNEYRYGDLRIRHDADKGEMVSVLKLEGSRDYGEEVRSQRSASPADPITLRTSPPAQTLTLPSPTRTPPASNTPLRIPDTM